MPAPLTGVRQMLLALAYIWTTVVSSPSAVNPRYPGRASWKLPKTDQSAYKGRHAPPNYIPISLSELNNTPTDSVAPSIELRQFATRDIETRAVIGTDDRQLLNNTHYPYSAMGRLLWADGTYCTASLVGDEFILTASHCVPWGDGSMSLTFQPDFFDVEVFGHAQVTDIAYIEENDSTNFNASACGVYLDFSIMRLDTVLSSVVGGTLGVLDWNSTLSPKELNHFGYPFDLAGGSRPYVQTGINATVDSGFTCDTDGPLTTQADAAAGQSGGPLWIPSGGTRYIVGTLSVSGSSDTVFASGFGLVTLVNWGRINWVPGKL